MEEFLLITILIVLFVRWLILSNRFAELKLRIENIVEDRQRQHEIQGLIKRVWTLEGEVAELKRSAAGPQEAPVVEPVALATSLVVEAPPEPPVPPPLPVVPAPMQKPLVSREEIRIETPPPALRVPEPAGPSFGQRTGEKMSSEEWEAIVGGSWLNKLGVFVLVVGIALFLGYSFTQVGPAGVAAIALAVSLAMLVGGAVLERRERYVIFARGLVLLR